MKRDIKIRGLDLDVIYKYDTLAKKHKMSRNKYLKGLLTNIAIAGETRGLEEKYRGLVELIGEVMNNNSESLDTLRYEIERLNYVLQQRGEEDDSETF